jgi:hypothetical protein
MLSHNFAYCYIHEQHKSTLLLVQKVYLLGARQYIYAAAAHTAILPRVKNGA